LGIFTILTGGAGYLPSTVSPWSLLGEKRLGKKESTPFSGWVLKPHLMAQNYSSFSREMMGNGLPLLRLLVTKQTTKAD